MFTSSVTVQTFINIKLQEKNLLQIKILKFFVSDHLKREVDVCIINPTPVAWRSSCLTTNWHSAHHLFRKSISGHKD